MLTKHKQTLREERNFNIFWQAIRFEIYCKSGKKNKSFQNKEDEIREQYK
jgi:hypothetical protein